MQASDEVTLPPQAEGASDLLRRTLVALLAEGRNLQVDWDLETFDVDAVSGPQDLVMGVVLSVSRAVVFYAVRPDYVPSGIRPVLADAVTRANTVLTTSTFELDLSTGNLSVRAGLEVGDVELPAPAFRGLLVNALDEVERAYQAFVPGLEDVIAGRTTPAEAEARWRQV
ncbi:type III secretion system chaperone family protein [Georgenia ruanii]|uniref:hypothetical protein n=1 Tax=Georgenia ruanii TaxID=348442 RepID=UPI001264D781|nr:hypothetical protein [Georgenia ruanii]